MAVPWRDDARREDAGTISGMGTPLATAMSSAMRSAPSNGRRPVRSSYNVAPTL